MSLKTAEFESVEPEKVSVLIPSPFPSASAGSAIAGIRTTFYGDGDAAVAKTAAGAGVSAPVCNVSYVINFNNGVSSSESRFATGMNGDEDLGQDITMKGEKFHYRKSDADGLFKLMDANVTRGNLKNLVTDKPAPITTKLRGDWFIPAQSGQHGSGSYERVIPSRFSGDSDDIFMRSTIINYAVEQKNKDGIPTGVFYLRESDAKKLASEVLNTHKGLSGKALQSYLDTYWAKAWGHFDVNKTGKIPALYAPGLMRFLASDQYMSLQ